MTALRRSAGLVGNLSLAQKVRASQHTHTTRAWFVPFRARATTTTGGEAKAKQFNGKEEWWSRSRRESDVTEKPRCERAFWLFAFDFGGSDYGGSSLGEVPRHCKTSFCQQTTERSEQIKPLRVLWGVRCGISTSSTLLPTRKWAAARPSLAMALSLPADLHAFACVTRQPCLFPRRKHGDVPLFPVLLLRFRVGASSPMRSKTFQRGPR